MEAITAEGRAEAALDKGRPANGGVADRRQGPSAPAPGRVIGSAPVVIALRHPENAAGQIRPPLPASQTPRVSPAVPRRCCTSTRPPRPPMLAPSSPAVGTRT